MRHVFIDESSQNAHHYMVLGALVLPGPVAIEAEVEIERLLVAERMHAELKWTKVSAKKLHVYKTLINYHFSTLIPRGAQFHALIVDCYALDHHTYNEGDSELGFNKFLYNLLFYRVGKPFGINERIVVDLDARNSTRDILELQTVLNHRMAKVTGERTRASFARVAFRNSKNSRLLQLADLLSGAIAWHKNDNDALPNASAAKCSLADYAASCVGLRRLGATSPKGEVRLSTWNFMLQPRGRGARQSRP